MKTCAVILAGGKGTRSADPMVAKVAQVIGGKSLLEWQLSLIETTEIEQIFVVTGHLGSEVKCLVESIHNTNFKIEIIHEELPRGTFNAIKTVGQETDFDTYLVLLGDVLAKLPLQPFLEAFESSDKNVGAIVHPSTHPEDSDLVYENFAGNVVVSAKGEPSGGIPNMSSAGLFIVSNSALMEYSQAKDIGSDLLALAARHNDLFTYNSSHYLKDTGTPDRLSRARADVDTGIFERRGNSSPRSAIFLDRDGVLNPVQPEIYRASDYHMIEGVAGAISEANTLGIPVMVVTNQPGIAKGYITFQDHEEIRAALDRQLASNRAFVDDYFYCPHHPDSGFKGEILSLKIPCNCRKPSNEMVLTAALAHGINLQSSYVIGDTVRDQGLATSVEANFVHVSDSCELAGDHICFPDTVNAVCFAISELTC